MIEAEALEDFPALLGKPMVRNVLFCKGLLQETASLGSFCNFDVMVEPVGAVDDGVSKGLQEKRLETMACNPLPCIGLLQKAVRLGSFCNIGVCGHVAAIDSGDLEDFPASLGEPMTRNSVPCRGL